MPIPTTIRRAGTLIAIASGLAAADATAPAVAPAPKPAPVLAAHDALGDLQIHGFASQGLLKTDTNNFLAEDSKRGTANFNEFALTVMDRPTDDLSIGMQFGARDVGDIGGDEPNLDWAQADYHWRDWLGLRVGKMKQPTGLYNEYRDVDLARTVVLLPQSVYTENLRDVTESFVGAQAYGDIPMDDAGSADYQVYAGNIVSKAQGLKELVSDGSPFTATSVQFHWTYGGRLTWIAPLPGLRVIGYYNRVEAVLSGYVTIPTPSPVPVTIPVSSENDVQFAGAGAEYAHEDLTFAAEYQHLEVHQIPLSAPGPVTQVGDSSGYGLVSYRFTPLLSVASYAGMIREKGQSGPHSYQKDLDLSVRLDPDPHWLVKLEGHYMTGNALVFFSDNPNGMRDHWWLFTAKTTFSF